MKELRSTHFNLGSMKPSYQTEANLYRSCNANSSSNQNKFEIPTYESGTWVDKEARFNAQTTNQREFSSKDVEPYKKHDIKVKGGFEFGSSKPTYETEFKKK